MPPAGSEPAFSSARVASRAAVRVASGPSVPAELGAARRPDQESLPFVATKSNVAAETWPLAKDEEQRASGEHHHNENSPPHGRLPGGYYRRCSCLCCCLCLCRCCSNLRNLRKSADAVRRCRCCLNLQNLRIILACDPPAAAAHNHPSRRPPDTNRPPCRRASAARWENTSRCTPSKDFWKGTLSAMCQRLTRDMAAVVIVMGLVVKGVLENIGLDQA